MKIKMNRAVMAGIVLLLLENGVVPWLVPVEWSGRLVPHLTFVLTVLVASFAGRHRAFLFGLGFGLIGDILYYGNLIGPYAFGMGLVGYAAGLMLERGIPTLASVLGATAAGSLALSTIVYMIYRLFRLTNWSYGYAFYWYMAPSLLLEILIALALYLPARRLLFKQPGSSGEESPL
ncbi:rod shape-determining protein MreD [Cohnella pontilimi]|uniref:Rod shape-determining protein MreD n=1 Tax=Cohnella pontilimi TaxID=2564100 RepID=A0A4U0FB90_9BACL|nr:rod shape-determining protein MreD [Cohnella pontilimi]TJY41444.1 rod shape-determining protein MreD [Cohnella pontilimi]